VKGQQELSEGGGGARYTAEARVPTAEAAMNTPFDGDFYCHFDGERTAGAVGRRGRGKVHSRSSCTNGGNGDGLGF